jgi:hypothetical protein
MQSRREFLKLLPLAVDSTIGFAGPEVRRGRSKKSQDKEVEGIMRAAVFWRRNTFRQFEKSG